MPADLPAPIELPAYDDLPVRAGAPAGSSWGLWGDDDRLGCLNLLSNDRVVEAAGLVRKGAVFALNLELHLPDPPLFGRAAPRHTVLGSAGHDDLIDFNTQSSSQWDGFRHVRSHHGNYNGIPDEEHGIHFWAERGLAGRAVLADVARWREAQGRPVQADTSDPLTPDDVDATLAAQGTKVRTGDVLILRTGWLAFYRTLDAAGRGALAADLKAPGLPAGWATARWLWNLHIAAIGADNPAVEAWPGGAHLSAEERAAIAADPERAPERFVHMSLLPLLGLPLGELWDLEALAADCAADGVYEGLFTSAPLRVVGGVASPPNALVLK